MSAITIDTERDDLVTLSEFAKTLPGKPVHIATVHRWRMRGIRGIKLPTVLIGGVRHTSRQAGTAWFAATTAAADGETLPTRTPQQRAKAVAAAERALEEMGA